jgi:geranylgeranyl pyrophosphate synthase
MPEGNRQPAHRDTADLKLVPHERAVRERIREQCAACVRQLDRSHPLSKDELEAVARSVLASADLPSGYLGWAMVILASEFWREQVAAIPPSRRLLLLPHCLKDAECPAEYDQFGLDCRSCGRCKIGQFGDTARALGYRVMVAEGSPVVMQVIISGQVDAIVGVACLDVLERAVDRVLLAGIPCMALPLLCGSCQNTSVDEDWVDQMIRRHAPQAGQQTRTYVHLMRAASRLFEPDVLEGLVPRRRGGPRLADVNGRGLASLDPIAATEAVAFDFLTKGGKYARPFITLAVYDAMTGGHCTLPDGNLRAAQIPDAVKRTALSIETFHKASLIHDDIEDDDDFRYGEQTLHRAYGVATAVNAGDYMIGLGYRLVSGESRELGPDVVADILDSLAEAHTRLSEGQGAELIWRDSRNKRLKPIDALKIYALKTAPAFEAALYCGLRLAGPAEPYAEPIRLFARNLGVAFQILNDLNDWRVDRHNKLTSGSDTLGGRPTVLWALAMETLPEPAQRELLELAGAKHLSGLDCVARVRQLYQQAGVFEQAHRLIDKHRQRAEQTADNLEPGALRRLLRYLIDTVLERA